MRIKNKVAIITGGASGLGKETAVLFAKEGARLVITDCDAAKGQQTSKDIEQMGYECTFFQADVRKEAEVEAFCLKTHEKYGKIDIIFNNAGIATRTGAEELTEEEWDRVVDIDLKGVFLCSKHVIPYMRKNGGGSIVNCASVLGHVAHPEACAYNAAKGGVVMLTKHLASRYSQDNIRANAVCPSFVKTPLLNMVDEETMNLLTQLHPMGRLADPLEVAYCALFLASDESSYVTGTSLLVDGGYTAV